MNGMSFGRWADIRTRPTVVSILVALHSIGSAWTMSWSPSTWLSRSMSLPV